MKRICFAFCMLISNLAMSQVESTDSILTLKSVEDRILISKLIDDYGYFADRREAQKQSSLFTQNGTMEIYRGEPDTSKPVAVLKGRMELKNAFATLSQYKMTFHLNGQKTIHLNGDSATGIANCLAHHIFFEKGKRWLMIMGIHYYDTYIRENNQWHFANRKLIIDFEDKRISDE